MIHEIENDTIDYVAMLSQLNLNDGERNRAKKDMEQMLEYVDLLDELDTENVEPLFHVIPMSNVLREDVVTNGDERELILENAPVKDKEMFVVPRTIG